MPERESTTNEATPALETDSEGVASLVFDDPERRVNVLTTPVMERLDGLLEEIEQGVAAGSIRALVVRSGKDGTFMAGADVDEIAGITDPAEGREKAVRGQAVFTRLEKLGIPTVAAVDGTCLGGGTELILACDVRLASDRPETRIGLPEIKLGILPGFGGTTRLPRLIGLMAAADIILAGKAVDARKAQKIGLIHERMHAGVLEGRARQIALDLAGGGSAPDRNTPGLVQRVAEGTPLGRSFILKQARKQVLEQTKGHYPAPLRAIEVMKRSAGKSLDRALEIEAQALGELIVTPESKSLIHVFHLMEDAKKAGPDASGRPVERVAVLGAGVMGGGIAQLLAYKGLAVRLKDIDQGALSTGLRHAQSMFDKLVKRRKMKKREADDRMSAISPTLEYAGLRHGGPGDRGRGGADGREEERARETEAAVRGGYGPHEQHVVAVHHRDGRPPSIGRSNFAGMHFFNPGPPHAPGGGDPGRADVGRDHATVFGSLAGSGKTPVIVNDGPGFLVNRVLTPYLNEAGYLLAEGAAIAEVDAALLDFGMPMGPLRLLDEVGLDIARHAGETMHEAFGERLAPSPALAALEETERLGRKNGQRLLHLRGGQGADAGPVHLRASWSRSSAATGRRSRRVRSSTAASSPW